MREDFELQYIKCPEGLGKIARDNFMYRSLMFWYKIKPIYASGRFEIKTFVHTVQSFHKISRTNIKFHLNILLRCGLIKQHGNYYQLTSYDKLFKHFGYDLTLKPQGKRTKKGNFAIDKIEVAYMPVIEDRIDCGEIKLNLRRQDYKLKELELDVMMPNFRFIQGDIRSRLILDETNIQLSKNSILSAIEKLHKCNIYNNQILNLITGISCKGLCNLLGFKSKKSVHDLKYRAAKRGLIEMIDQRVRFKEFCNFNDEVLLKYFLRPDFHFKGSFGQPLEYQLCDYFFFHFD